MTSVKFVYFDIGGVLLDLSKLFETLIERSSKPKKDVMEVFEKHDVDLCRGSLSSEEMADIYRSELGMEVGDLEMLVVNALEPRQSMKRFVEELPASLRVGLLSNTWGNITHYQIEKNTIPDYKYEAMVLSNEVGAAKPEEKIYQIAHEKAGVEPGKILFVDDMEVNVKAAQDLGWQGLVFDVNDEKRMISEIEKRLSI